MELFQKEGVGQSPHIKIIFLLVILSIQKAAPTKLLVHLIDSRDYQTNKPTAHKFQENNNKKKKIFIVDSFEASFLSFFFSFFVRTNQNIYIPFITDHKTEHLT